MTSHLSLLLCITVLCSLACNYRVCSLEVNTTTIPTNATRAGDNHVNDRTKSMQESSQDDEDEETDEDFSVTGYIIDDSIRVQPVVKPEETKKKGEKKKGEKKKKKKGQNEKKKKKDPCQTTHKDFCIHGECKYLASVEEVSCRCQRDYFGERCSEQYMKTEGTTRDFADVSTTALAVAAVLLSTISIIAIIIIIIVHTRRKYSSYECEAEEKKKLGQENGSEEIEV